METQSALNNYHHPTSIRLYEGCGNKLLIVHFGRTITLSDIRLRKHLVELGLQYDVDSVMVLTGNPQNVKMQGFHVSMDVFEPRGLDPNNPDMPGCWSTMCGNGVRAVARYLVDSGDISCLIQTRSGLRSTTILPDNNFRVCMGRFAMRREDIRRYVRNFNYFRLLPVRYRSQIEKIVVGLNGDPDHLGRIDGEPHLLIFLRNQVAHIEQVSQFATLLGRYFTTNRAFFPECINTNVISINIRTNDEVQVLAATYERGVEYVTQACGTGATAIGSYLLSKQSSLDRIRVHMPGGELIIEPGFEGQYYMTGPANPVRVC